MTRQTPCVTDVRGVHRTHPLLEPNGRQPAVGLVAPSDRAAIGELEDLGVASLWVGGHVASPNPTPEATVKLARLAALTERVRIGTAVLLLPLYAPAKYSGSSAV